MEYIQLGRSDLMVSRMGLGCEQLSGVDWGEFNEDTAIATVHKALDLGINFFDTADVYGLGRSEKILAKALGVRRKEMIICTKLGVNWKGGSSGGRARTFFDSSRAHLMAALEGSLRRLKVDCIPLCLINWPDLNTPIAETMEALSRCQKSGKIRHIGISNFPVPLIREANRLQSLTCVELLYNLIDRYAEQKLLPYCRELGVGVLVYGPLAQGLLTGKYDSQTRFAMNDRRHRLPHFQGLNLVKNLEIVDRIKSVASRYKKSPAQVSIRWILQNPVISSVITGSKSPAQIEDNVGALTWHMDQEDWSYLAGTI